MVNFSFNLKNLVRFSRATTRRKESDAFSTILHASKYFSSKVQDLRTITSSNHNILLLRSLKQIGNSQFQKIDSHSPLIFSLLLSSGLNCFLTQNLGSRSCAKVSGLASGSVRCPAAYLAGTIPPDSEDTSPAPTPGSRSASRRAVQSRTDSLLFHSSCSFPN